MIDRLRRADPVLVLVPPLLACASLVLVYSASSILGITSYNDPYYFLFRRTIHLLIGLAAFAFLYLVSQGMFVFSETRDYMLWDLRLDPARVHLASALSNENVQQGAAA